MLVNINIHIFYERNEGVLFSHEKLRISYLLEMVLYKHMNLIKERVICNEMRRILQTLTTMPCAFTERG